MNRKEIIQKLSKYFDIQELVCPHTFKAFGNLSWQFLDTQQLHTILVLREDILKVPMVCNDYKFGGKITQRGFRCNICSIPKDKTLKNQIYLSAHCNGAGNDFVFSSSTDMSAEKARQIIKANQHLLPYNIRIEKTVTWLHVDTYDTGNKVGEFNP